MIREVGSALKPPASNGVRGRSVFGTSCNGRPIWTLERAPPYPAQLAMISLNGPLFWDAILRAALVRRAFAARRLLLEQSRIIMLRVPTVREYQADCRVFSEQQPFGRLQSGRPVRVVIVTVVL